MCMSQLPIVSKVGSILFSIRELFVTPDACVDIMKTILLVCVLCFIHVRGNQEDLNEIDSIFREKPCTDEGGLCVVAKDCPKGSLSKRLGLCPAQQASGVECCYSVSVKETRCQKHGGSCLSASICHPSQSHNASDCSAGQTCCIFI
ncbi:unnamed protein product [Leptidea sinapis]|uniref:Uncharacterized protein n=1 Tax=Leptidea sinapis TaxID=189913 RepID=A0A5E4PST5_9NEOP|nr:unnamed protein product [Leptidea sinapis]